MLCYLRFIIVLQPDNTAKCEIDTLVDCVCFTFWTDKVWSGLGRVWTHQSCFEDTSWLQVVADLVSGFTTTITRVMRFTARGSNNSCFSVVGYIIEFFGFKKFLLCKCSLIPWHFPPTFLFLVYHHRNPLFLPVQQISSTLFCSL